MNKLSDWSLAKKLQENKKAGIITGVLVALVVVALIVAIVLKVRWLKKQYECHECDLDDDFELEFDDEDGVFTVDEDFE